MAVAPAEGQRYGYLRGSDLISGGLYGYDQSADVTVINQADGNLLLFLGASYIPGFEEFSGQFLQLTAAKTTSGSVTNSWNFNFETFAVLAIAGRREGFNETRLSFTDTFQATWIQQIDTQLGKTNGQVTRNGDPTLTWMMFPANPYPIAPSAISNSSALDPNTTYLQIWQPLNVNVPVFGVYGAILVYHIVLAPDASQHLRASAGGWGWWVQDGIKATEIAGSLGPEVENFLPTLVSKANGILSGFDGLLGTVTDVYYLPGTQLSPIGTGTYTDFTTNDITIVIEHL